MFMFTGKGCLGNAHRLGQMLRIPDRLEVVFFSIIERIHMQGVNGC